MAWGAIVFSWLMIEDDRVVSVALLGLGVALIAGMSSIMRQFGGKQISNRFGALLLGFSGGMIGAGGAAFSATLMFLKTAIHSHLYPDYPVGLMLAMLERVPAWSIAGLLLGVSVWLILQMRYGVSSLST